MYKKSMMHVQSCCFTNLNLSFFFSPFSLLSPLSLLNLGPIVVIQKFSFHGNLMPHFSSLLPKLLKMLPGVIIKLFWGMLHDTIRDLTMQQWWRQWKLCWKIDFASFKIFPPLYQVTQSLERRKVRLELKRGDRIRVQREEVKFIALPFPFSSPLKIWSFHIVVVQGQQRMYKKAWCTCRVVVLLIKFSPFLTFLLLSPL